MRMFWVVLALSGCGGGGGNGSPDAPVTSDTPTDSDPPTMAVFADPTDLATTFAASVALADLDGDGKPDILAAGNGISVLLNTTPAGAAPTFATHVDVETGSTVGSIVLADVNQDGKPDLVVSRPAKQAVSVLLNTTAPGASTPSLGTAIDFPIGGNDDFFAVAVDINGDGKLDLVASRENAGIVTVLLNTTANGATAPTFANHVDITTGAIALDLAVADFDGDGRPDLAVSGISAIAVLRNTTVTGATVPAFAPKVDLPSDGNASALVSADIDGDGKPDLVVAAQRPGSPGHVDVFVNKTASGAMVPSFSTPTELAAPNAHFLAAGNVTGDGRVDVVVASELADPARHVLSVLVNATPTGATPSFTTTPDVSGTAATNALAIADLDGDGKADVVTGNGLVNSVSVFRGR